MRSIGIVLGHLWCAINSFAGWLFVKVGGSVFERTDPVYSARLYLAKEGGYLVRFMDGGGVGGVVGGGVAGITIGVIIVFRNRSYLENETMLKHENHHVLQGFWWGPFHVFAYLIGMLVAKLQGKDAYAGCFLEEDARKAAGE